MIVLNIGAFVVILVSCFVMGFIAGKTRRK